MQWLSQEWIDGLTAALNADEGFQKAASKKDKTIRYVFIEAPEGGEISYGMTIADGVVALSLEDPADPDVTFTCKYVDGARVARGELSAQQAAMGGQIKADVNPMKVMKLVPLLQAREAVEKTLDVEVPE